MRIHGIIYVLIASLVFDTQAAKFIRNIQTKTCLRYTVSSSCSPISSVPCPTERFNEISNDTVWNVVPVNPSSPLNSSSEEIFIESSDNKLCLSASSSGVNVCPCDGTILQKWSFNNDNLISSSNKGQCLSMVGGNFGLSSCQPGVATMSWESYHVVPNMVVIYGNTLFTGNDTKLYINTFTSSNLPSSIFSSPFSLEIPPGFQLTINQNNKIITYTDDIPQLNPISDFTSIFTVSLRSGIVIYEEQLYFGVSQFYDVGDSNASVTTVGSVMVPKGLRGVIWSSSNFSGNNFGLFEPIPSFSGTPVSSIQIASLDVSGTCQNECTSGGFCSANETCTCKPGFTGQICDQCLPGFWGPDCQACSCGNSTHKTCDDGFFGTGECKCAPGFTGSDCNCNCGNGTCDSQGHCICNAGWTTDNNGQCTQCKSGYSLSGGNCVACNPGCTVCDSTGKCTQCFNNLIVSTDDPTICVPNTNANASCDPSCETCFGPGPNDCLSCNSQEGKYYFEGSCVPQRSSANDGRCLTTSSPNNTFYVDTSRSLCEACPSTCLDCFIPQFSSNTPPSNMQCNKCMPGLFLDSGKCVPSCPAGKYVSQVDNVTCTSCDASCATCNGPSTNRCLSCSNLNLFAFNGKCSSTPCPSSFVSINTTCTKCHPDCSECSGPESNQCTKCPSNRPILTGEGQCVETCPIGQYSDSTGKCQECNSACSSCVGPQADQCLGCADQSKVLLDGKCGGCPSNSTVIQSERICYNLEENEVVSPDSFTDSNTANTSRKLEWWQILLIVVSGLIALILMVLLIRCCAVKRRKKKTNEFKEQIDENAVQKKMFNLKSSKPRHNNHKKRLSRPEISYGASSKSIMRPHEIDAESLIAFGTAAGTSMTTVPMSKNQVSEETPPSYNPEDGKEYWDRVKRNSSYSGKDYQKWKSDKDMEKKIQEEAEMDSDGFEIIIATGKRSSLKRMSSGVRRSGTVIMGDFGYVNKSGGYGGFSGYDNMRSQAINYNGYGTGDEGIRGQDVYNEGQTRSTANELQRDGLDLI